MCFPFLHSKHINYYIPLFFILVVLCLLPFLCFIYSYVFFLFLCFSFLRFKQSLTCSHHGSNQEFSSLFTSKSFGSSPANVTCSVCESFSFDFSTHYGCALRYSHPTYPLAELKRKNFRNTWPFTEFISKTMIRAKYNATTE